MKISKSSDEEIILLSSKLLDGVISPLEHSRLSKLLKESPHNRASYLEIVRMESQLYWESGVSDVELHQSKTNEKIIPFAIPLWISSVAAIFLAIFAVWQTSDKSDQDSSNIVNFTDPSIEGVNGQTGFANNPVKSSRSDSSMKSSKIFSKFEVSEVRQSELSRGISILEQNDRFASGGVFEFAGPVKRWNRISMLLRPSEKGVLPSSGTSMIGFEKMTIDVEAQHAQTEETVQVLDVREAMKEVGSDKARIFASVKFNQSFGNSHEGAEFGLVLQAYKKEQKNEEVELVRLEKKLASDRDPNTWSGLSSELEIPVDADYLVVSLSARKQGPDALLAHASSYYADDLELFLSFGEESLIGPI